LSWRRRGPQGEGFRHLPGPDGGNPHRDHHIAELSANSKLRMEMTVRMGKGYVSAERNLEENAPIGTIPIDAIFSPIRKVNFAVTNARVGQQTDYDRLTLEIWTDGSLLPADAVAYAAKIMKDQLTVFINFDDEAEIPDEPARLEEGGRTRISTSRWKSWSSRFAPIIA